MNDLFLWMLRLSMIPLIIGVHHASPALAWALVLAAGSAAFLKVASRGRLIPRFFMDILERLTDKHVLEQAYTAKSSGLAAIDADELARRLRERVVGQNDTVDSIAQQLRRRLAGRRPEKPIAVFCFAGAPGIGKTLLAKVLAEALYGDKNHLHFFDMSQFSQPHAAASLFGQARGYVGSQSYGSLTAALRDVPQGVVLLDEFEKAHPDVHKRFLTAWNDGFVTETSDGARVSTRDAIFILTTNAASRRIGELAREHHGSPEELGTLVKSTLADAQFAPEVLSRIDEVFAFKPLQGLDIARVVALELESLAAQYGLAVAGGGIDHRILLNAIESMQQKMGGGVRDISRALERQVTDAFIDARASGARIVRLRANGDGIEVETADRLAGPPDDARVVAA